MPNNKTDRDVYIVEAGGEYRVRPAVAAVKAGKSNSPNPNSGSGHVFIRNATTEAVVVSFPLNAVVTGQDLQKIGAGDHCDVTLQDLPNSATSPVVFTYFVYVSKNGELILAKGESGPMLIVDP